MTIAVAADEIVEASGAVLTHVFDRLGFVCAIDQDGGSVLNLSTDCVVSNDALILRSVNLDVTELHLATVDRLEASQLVPLVREALAAAACVVDVSNNPDEVIVRHDSILKGV